MKRPFVKFGVLAAILGPLLTACGDSTDVGGTTTLKVLLTDAPSEYIDAAMVDIGPVELIGGAGGPVLLTTDGTSGPVNLLDLQDAATTALASVEIESGSYTQLRLVVEEASVTLASGYEFTSGGSSMDLTVPSGAQTGIKLNLSAGDAAGTEGRVDITPGEMVLVVDFDVNESFVLQGNPETPAGINSVSFQPTLRVVVNDVAGSISGTVTPPSEGLVVTADPVDGTTLEPFQTAAASAMTDAQGNYTIFFLVPGDYEVSADPGPGLTSTSATVTVGESEDVTEVDLQIS
jgi:hypothetical protein